jgi:transposase
MISKETEAEIVRLYHGEKWPIGTIAGQLGLHHTTVQRVLRHTGVDPKVVAPRPSIADPFVPFIVEQLQKYPGLRASRLFVMIKERGYPGGPDHLRRVVSRLRAKKPAEGVPAAAYDAGRAGAGRLGALRQAHDRPCAAPALGLRDGAELFAPAVSALLSGHRQPFFVRGHVEAFSDFGGVPRVLLYDNLKSAVLDRHGDASRFHPTLLAVSAHYRFEPRPVAVARGNEKNRVERAIRYIREAFFAARSFADLTDLNQQAAEWTATAAIDRPWVEDRERTVRQAFEDERSLLLPLPSEPFPAHERVEVEVEVGKTPYIRFDLNDYSVPHDRTQRTLVVFADLETLRIAEGNDIVATHLRSWDRGQQLEQAHHLQRLVDEKRRSREHRGLDRLARAARSSQAFLRIVAERGDNVGSTTVRLLQLLDTAGGAELEEALVEALERDTVHVGAVRQIVDRRRSARGLPPPLSIPVTRGEHAALVVTPHALSTYDALKKEDP